MKHSLSAPLALLALLVSALPLFELRAIELPGSEAWAGLILGQIDSNGDTSVDTGEWSDGLSRAFDALDRDLGGAVDSAEVDAVKDPIANTLGETGATVAILLIKKLMKLDGASPAPYTRETFDESARELFGELDLDKSSLLEEEELKSLPLAIVRWLQ